MGRVAGSYGVRGWIRVERPEQALADCSKWWIGGQPNTPSRRPRSIPARCSRSSPGSDSREAAQELKGSKCAVQREALPEPEQGKYYLADLVGLEVVNEQGEALGVVKRMFTNGAQDVMEVAGETGRGCCPGCRR